MNDLRSKYDTFSEEFNTILTESQEKTATSYNELSAKQRKRADLHTAAARAGISLATMLPHVVHGPMETLMNTGRSHIHIDDIARDMNVPMEKVIKNIPSVFDFAPTGPSAGYLREKDGPHKAILNIPRNTNEATIAHELGHVKNWNMASRLDKGKLGDALYHGYFLSRQAAPALGLAAGIYSMAHEDPSYIPAVLNLAANVPTLLDEGMATAHAVKHMVKSKGMLRGIAKSLSLVPAYGTYAGLALTPLALVAARKRILENAKKSPR